MNERLKELRESLGLTLDKFGSNLGVQRAAINKLEKGDNKLSKQMFLLICKTYNVNPDWLKNGTGPMFLEKSEDDEYAAAAAELSSDPLVRACLMEYAKLSPKERDIVRNYIDNLLTTYKKDTIE